ncbi:ATP-binding protein [Streptomyces sp. NPDC049915]|uniref:ATP-binding protein n=1 Tax=Streptomyces sp. NPDC049915 TaxID=3155510 RepID=UPI00343CE189
MKQSAAKTLGVAALGAAFAAAGAGAANAAPALPDASQAVGGLTQTLPTENVAQAVPGAGAALAHGPSAAGAGLAAAHPVVGKALADGPAKPVTGLLGGLPVQGLGSSGLKGNPLG